MLRLPQWRSCAKRLFAWGIAFIGAAVLLPLALAVTVLSNHARRDAPRAGCELRLGGTACGVSVRVEPREVARPRASSPSATPTDGELPLSPQWRRVGARFDRVGLAGAPGAVPRHVGRAGCDELPEPRAPPVA